MNIVIYGTARSGTKAAQLYISYLLAKKYNKVRLNYEPYFWTSRKGVPNLYNLSLNLSTSPITENNRDFSSSHTRMLKGLVSNNYPTVTKFIRANGRTNEVNKIMNVDGSIFIVRNLTGVLNSLSELDFNLYSHGSYYFSRLYFDSWNKIINDGLNYGVIPDRQILNYCINQTTRNAMIWYILNKIALVASENTFIKYSNIQNISYLLKERMNIVDSLNYNIENSFFKGKYINSDKIVKNITNLSLGKPKSKIYNLNQILLSFHRKNTKSYRLFKQETRDIIEINDSTHFSSKIDDQAHKNHGTREYDNFVNDLNSEVMELLNKREYLPT